jgi:hypothetical protein
MDDADGVVSQRPVLAALVVVVVGAAAYAGVSRVMRGTVVPLEVALFVVVFALVYLGFSVYAETIEGYLGL